MWVTNTYNPSSLSACDMNPSNSVSSDGNNSPSILLTSSFICRLNYNIAIVIQLNVYANFPFFKMFEIKRLSDNNNLLLRTAGLNTLTTEKFHGQLKVPNFGYIIGPLVWKDFFGKLLWFSILKDVSQKLFKLTVMHDNFNAITRKSLELIMTFKFAYIHRWTFYVTL